MEFFSVHSGDMKLYICFTTAGPDFHFCARAYRALTEAGYEPEIEKVGGIGFLPKAFNKTTGRKKVSELTGNHHVPALVLDDETVVDGTQNIVNWATSHTANK